MSALTNVDRREVLRYLGAKGAVDDALIALVETAIERVANAAKPRAVIKEWPLSFKETTVHLGVLAMESAALSEHLRGCDRAYVLAATLGADVDRLLMRDSVAAPSLAVTEQAVAAAMIELVCDDETAKQAAVLPEGCFLRERFSPGYGDFSLAHQHDVLRLLDAGKRIGLAATETCMLTPMKSVTAVIGISNQEIPCAHSRCAGCGKHDCAFRKDDNE